MKKKMGPHSIRIINLDSYMCTPVQGLDVMYSEFRGSAINRVPILRLFGSTEDEYKICLHIHGVFPYFYVPYDGVEEVNTLMYQIAASIDKAINVSLNQSSSNTQHVYKISLVSGIPMYGFHSKKHQFFKIHLYNPLLIRRVSNLLMNETTLGKLYQPHEVHLPFTLQFMIDYNLHGMSNLLLSEMKFRGGPNNVNINAESILPSVIKKMSVCELEGDALAENILNRLEVASGNIGVNPGISALWADEMQRRRNKGETSQIEHLLELKNITVEPTMTHKIFKQALLDRLAITSTDNDVVSEKLNLSVYPAETPENMKIQNASLIDSEIPSSLELSLNDTTLTSTDLNYTNKDISQQLSESMDEQDQSFLRILQNLEANVNEDVEEDSILSQTVKENEEDKDLDLSMPLESIMTPKKFIPEKEDSSDNDDFFNTTIVPQLDGECDDDTEDRKCTVDHLEINDICNRRITRSFKNFLNDQAKKEQTIKEPKFIKKTLYVKLIRINGFVKKGRSMPLLDEDFDDSIKYTPFKTELNMCEDANDNKENIIINVNQTENIIKCKLETVKDENTYTPKKRHRIVKYKNKSNRMSPKKTAAELKSWQYQFKMAKRRHRILKMMKKIHDKEHRIWVLLSKNFKPAFKVVPGRNSRMYMFPSVNKWEEEAKINILSDIMLQTRNHIDPDLHLILQYSTEKSVLYIYNNNIYPIITKVPRKFTKIGNEEILRSFIISKFIEIRNSDQSNIKQEIDCDVEEDKLKHSIEFLRNNIKPFSIILRNDLQYSNQPNDHEIEYEVTENNTQLEQLFPKEIIDSENEKHCYIFSSKYLIDTKDNDLTNSIKNMSLNDIVQTVKHLKEELIKHVSYLTKPISYKNTLETIKPNDISNKEIKEPDAINKDSVQLENFAINLNNNIKTETKVKKEHVERKNKNNCDKVKIYDSKAVNNKTYLNHIKKDIDTIYEEKEPNNNSNINLLKCKQEIVTYEVPNKCLFLDGAWDSSSSSEDESGGVKRKRVSKKDLSANVFRYSSLPITVTSSPSLKSQTCSSDKQLVSQSEIKKFKEKKTPLIKPNKQQTVCDINVKRKLNFASASPQTTIIEENLVCSFSPLKTHRKVVSNINNLKSQLSQPNSTSFYQDSNSKNVFDCATSVHDLKTKTEDPENSTNFKEESDIEISSHHETFSDNDSGDDSFFRSPEIAVHLNDFLTTAQKYDKECNYNAKEGTSKVTPQSSIGSQKSSDEIHHSSGSSSFGLLTPYQRVAEETHLDTILEDRTPNQNTEAKVVVKDSEDVTSLLHSVINGTNCDIVAPKVLIPIKKAPTRGEVIKCLDKLKIPSVKQQLPFYSNIEDVTGSVEVGYNVLKIISNTTAHLPEFDSQWDSINNFRKLHLENMSSNLEMKKSNVNSLTLGFCKDRDCIIVPIRKPPSLKVVKDWIKEKSKKVITPEKKIEKKKIFIPLSPDNNGGDGNETDISLTISPCTPVSQDSTSQTVLSSQTPKSSKTTDDCSPVLSGKFRRKRKFKEKLSESITPSLRKSLLISQDKSSNASNTSCQITGVSLNNTYGFDHSTENLQAARAVLEHQNLTVLVMELHIQTRGEFKPNPDYDSIRAIFYSILNDVPENHPRAPKCKGVIAINSLPIIHGEHRVPILDGAGINCNVTYVESEENLLNEFLKLVEYWDPDIFAGYEIQMLSWGYLIDRASVLGLNFKCFLSRTKEDKKSRDEEGQNDLQIIGRIMLDVWRLMRHEIALQSYTFESIIYHILHKRVPAYSFKDLSFWWDHRSSLYRYRTTQYYLFRVEAILELFDKLDIIGRTSELARLFGIQFFEVLSRGSQFRVESMMLRLAKPLNFIPVSPSVQQRATMKAPEYIPLVLEPESKLYNDPVIVLDFQSLYPSIIIAYNYCFTTCLGRVECLGKNSPFEFGASQLKVSTKLLQKLLKKDLLNFSPCGVGFVKKEVRDGILPRMLREILDTRLMVKNSMKENQGNQLLQKVLHNRQLGLKLIANVTYGYTAANFSGRMPSVEVGDSVVSKGRETLQRAIEMVDNTAEWGARVVYGDTDSLFVMVPGKTKEHAFEIGKKIADAVTNANPDPIKLKLEKVYQPCILQTKKRYVGYMYESPDQKEPVYDAKGIETVRRDGCPAVSKMLEKCLRLLFETKDVSLIKKYVLRQFNKILAGRASIQDLTFAKEYRGAAGYRQGACVPSLELAKKWTAVDKRNEPRRGERVPYIIINGPPGLPLIRLVRSPKDLLKDPSLRPNAMYYITKVIIPPINRCFNLIGADLNTWFNQMPRKQIQSLPSSVSPGKKSTISQYFSTTNCVCCGEQSQTGICNVCTANPQTTTITLIEKLRGWERNNSNCNMICQSCTGTQTEIKCVSLDCPVLYRRIQTNRDVQQCSYIRELMSSNEFLF